MSLTPQGVAPLCSGIALEYTASHIPYMFSLKLAVIWLLKNFRVFKAFFGNVFSPKGWQKNSQKCRNLKNSILSIVQWFYPLPHANSMQQTPQVHLNTSPTSFEGLRGLGTRTTTQNL